MEQADADALRRGFTPLLRHIASVTPRCYMFRRFAAVITRLF